LEALISQDATPEAGQDNCWQYRYGAVVLSAGAKSLDAKGFVVGLYLDDRAEAVADDDHHLYWREWLRLSNLMAFKRYGLTIGSVDMVSVPIDVVLPPEESSAAVSPEWQELLEMATDDERPLLIELAAIDGLPVPELGFELPDGSVVSIAWEELKVGVLLDGEDPQALIDAGWTAVGPDAADVANSLSVMEGK
jgi:hypothetical protein